jgi:hypothetical protein
MALSARDFFGLLLSLAVTSTWSLTPDDIDRIRIGSNIELPVVDADTPTQTNMGVKSITQFTDIDGRRWYRFDGNFADQKQAVVLMHVENELVEVESAINIIQFRDIGINKKSLWKIDKQRSGEVIYDKLHYKYNDDDSEDAEFSKDAAKPQKMSYYRFECVEDDDLSILIFEWNDDQFELLNLEWVDTAKVIIQ